MNVHLTPELETLVQNKVKTGRYNSASEVVREALRLFEERDRISGNSRFRSSGRKSTRDGLLSNAAREWTERNSSGLSDEKNGNWRESTNGHEALQTFA